MIDQNHNFEIETALLHFKSAFDDTVINRYSHEDSNETGISGNIRQKIKVNYVFGPKQRILADLEGKTDTVKFPIVAICPTGMGRDDQRVKNKNDNLRFRLTDGSYGNFQIVPWNINVSMSIMAKFQEDITQIISNFAVMANPYIVFSWREPKTGREVNAEVFWDGQVAMEYPGANADLPPNSPFRVMATANFVIKTYLYRTTIENTAAICKINTDVVVTKNFYCDYESLVSETADNDRDSYEILGKPQLRYVNDWYFRTGQTPEIIVQGDGFALTDAVFVSGSNPDMYTLSSYEYYGNKFKGQMVPEFEIIDAQTLKFTIPSSSALGLTDLIVVNECGIGQLTVDADRCSRVENPYKTSQIEYYEWQVLQFPYLNGLIISNEMNGGYVIDYNQQMIYYAECYDDDTSTTTIALSTLLNNDTRTVSCQPKITVRTLPITTVSAENVVGLTDFIGDVINTSNLSYSSYWNDAYTSISTQSSNNISVYNSVFNNSANWIQILSFDENNASLTISDGNTISLSSLTLSSAHFVESDPYFTSWANTYSSTFINIEDVRTLFVNITGDVMTGGLSSPSISADSLYVGDNTINFIDGLGHVVETLNSNDVVDFKSSSTTVNSRSAYWEKATEFADNSAYFATYDYVDSNFINITGGTLQGDIDLDSYNITNVNVLCANHIIAVSSTVQYQDITIYELSGFGVTGNVDVSGNINSYNSVNWDNTYTTLSNNSANYDSAYNTVNSNSATNWNYQGTDIKELTGNWEDTYNTVQDYSALWIIDNTIDTGVRSLTSNWQNTYINFSTQSANNIDVYNTVNSYSATWVNDAPQTLTFNNINAELTISGGNTVSLSSLSGGGNGSVGVSYLSALNDVSIPSPVNGQVLTYNSITNKWNAGTPLSASGATGYYGSFYDTTAQTLTSTTQAKRINIAQTYEHNGVSIDNNRIVFNYDGVYELIYSIQYKNTSSAQHDIYIWLKQNGVDIPNSSSVFTINARKSASIPAQMIAVSPFMSTLTAGDFIELYWHCNDTSVTVETFTTHANPTIPDTPGVIVTVKQVTNVQIVPTVGAYLPLSGGTLTGAVSTTNVLYTTGGNSDQWNSVYNNVNSNSAINWNYQGTDIKALTGNWGASGSGNELQFRTNAGAFGAVTNSSVSGGAIILGDAEALSATSVGYLTLRNTTSAVAGTQQVSPSIALEGRGFATTSGTSQTVRFRENVLPVQGTANPSATWRLQSEINNNGTWTDRLVVDSSGVLTLPSSTPTIQNTTGQQLRHSGTGWEIINSSAVTFRVDYNSISMAASLPLGWGSTASASFGGNDTMLFRDAAGVIAQRNGLLPQTSRLYNTYTSATTGENLQMQWASNEARIGTSVGSGGGVQRPLVFGSWNSSGTWSPAINIATTGTVSVSGAINANNGILSSSQPVLNTTQTWSNSAVAFTGSVLNIVNTSSSSSSVIQEWQVNGVRSLAILGSDGFGRISGSTINSGFSFNGQSANRMAIYAGGSMLCYLSPTDFGLRGNAAIRWDITGGDPNSTGNGLSIMRDNQNHILGQRAAANPQTSNIYNTYTNASNYERGFSRWRGSSFTATISGTTMTLTVASVGTFAVGQRIAGTGVTSGTLINSLASGTLGAVGSTYTLSISQTVATATIMNSYSDVYEIGTESLGTGVARALSFFTNGVERINIGATGNITTTNTLSTTNVIYASGGNSDQWNSTYTTVQAISAVEDANTIIGFSLFL